METYDKYLNAEFYVNRDGEKVAAKVTKRARDNDSNPIGRASSNPFHDTREYDCLLGDGTEDRYHANVIAKNIYAQCDDKGKMLVVLKEITDHTKDGTALTVANGFVTKRNGTRVPKTTTRGWKLLCQWKDGISAWVPLKEPQESNPIELADYAVANRLQEEPAFK